MSSKVSIANVAMVSLGHEQISALDDSTPLTAVLSDVFEEIVTYLLTDDWQFNRKRISLADLTQIYRLEVDAAPSPSSFAIGATITGQSSAVTCTVVEVLSDTVYLVTEPSDDFTIDETLGDGTNTATYSSDSDNIKMGQYAYGYSLPSDYLLNIGVSDLDSDKIKYRMKREGQILLSQVDEGFYHYNKYLGSAGVSDLTNVPIWFERLISARLAYVLSANITENIKIRPKAELDWQTAYREAKEKNGMEIDEQDFDGENYWIDSAFDEAMNL